MAAPRASVLPTVALPRGTRHISVSAPRPAAWSSVDNSPAHKDSELSADFVSPDKRASRSSMDVFSPVPSTPRGGAAPVERERSILRVSSSSREPLFSDMCGEEPPFSIVSPHAVAEEGAGQGEGPRRVLDLLPPGPPRHIGLYWV